MALRPGLGAAGSGSGAAAAASPSVSAGAAASATAAGPAGSPAGPGAAAGPSSSFMFPVAAGLGHQGMISMPQQAFSMVSVLPPNMLGVNYGPPIPPGAMATQVWDSRFRLGGMPLGPMPAAGMSYLGQAPAFLGMRPAAPQYTPDMRKQFAEEQQKRFEHQQKFLEEERKRRQFEEQKQKLRLLSSVKPKMGEKSRDDALEAIKGNLDGFSRDAKLHPTPTSHPKNADLPTPSHSTVSVSHTSAFPDDDEFSDFIQGPAEPPPFAPPASSRPFPPCHPPPPPPPQAGQRLPEGLAAQPLPPFQLPVSSIFHGTAGPLPYFSSSAASQNTQKTGVGVFPSQDPIQPLMPPWIYNDGLVPDLYKKILETTVTPTGIDTGKLYPILMSSGLPRETLGQIWALANRTTPGKLTKEELYTMLAMIAVAQRGVPAMSPEVLNQFPSAPIPSFGTLSMAIPVTVSQPPRTPAGPPGSVPRGIGAAVVGLGLAAPVGGAAPQPAGGFLPSFATSQAAKPDDDDFQDFQDASKSGGLDDTFPDFQGEGPGPSMATPAHHRTSAPSMLMPLSGPKMPPPVDKYAAFKGMASEKPAEAPSSLGDYGDKYSAFRELEQPPESKPLGDSLAGFGSPGADGGGFTEFKTADSISPLDLPTNEKPFPPPFSALQPPPAKPSLNLADLDLFSAASSEESRPLPFPAAYHLPKLPSFPTPPLSAATAAAATLPIPGHGSGLADNFADFSLFGGLSSCTSAAPATTQDEFADFMAFGHGPAGSEQKPEERPSVPKREASPGPPAPAAKSGQSPTAAAHSKYDIFKQLSLDSPGLGFEEAKDHTPSSAKSEEDFADFHANKFSSSSERSLVDKLAAFRQAKEDSASVKSLDLPSIGGSSVGKEDSEDALSVQFDMKLVDVGGDLKHVLSDSSLDLPTVSGQHPPAADLDDFKCAPFGSCGSFPSYDWSDREDAGQAKQASACPLPPGSGPSLATSVLQKKETFFGSSENVTMTTLSKVTTFAGEGAFRDATFPPFARFQDSEPQDAEDFGAFARPSAEAPAKGAIGPEAVSAAFSLEAAREGTDDFGEFQSEKPKISKFDFLLANSQGKVKSSEEMIKSEIATFDLSVQGSHKRSLSLGDREIIHSSSLEQPFRDRSNTLSEKPALPVIRDKYKDLTGEVEESERYAYEWQRCLESALQVIRKANDTLNGISSSSVCTEVIQSAQGMEYLLGVVEVYRVAKRVELGIKATAVCSEALQRLLKDIDKTWNNLIGFMSLAALTPDENSLDFSSCLLRPGIKNAQELACGVCLLNVDSRSKKEEKPAEERPREAFHSDTDHFKLAYGGHQYHASCANFWINCVEPKPPGLLLPDLL